MKKDTRLRKRHQLITAGKLVVGEPIQWHWKTSAYDECPKCGNELWFMKSRHRFCPLCDTVFSLMIPTTQWRKETEEAT